MASPYELQQYQGPQTAGNDRSQGSMFSRGPMGDFTNAIVGGRNDWRAQTANLDTSQLSLEAAMAEDARRRQLETGAAFLPAAQQTIAQGQTQALSVPATRGVSPALASALIAQDRANAVRQNQILQAQAQEQARQGMIAGLAAQRGQYQDSRAQSLEEAKAQAEAENLTNELNTDIRKANQRRADKGLGSLFSGIAGGLGQGALSG